MDWSDEEWFEIQELDSQGKWIPFDLSGDGTFQIFDTSDEAYDALCEMGKDGYDLTKFRVHYFESE